jgi:hypothetical protein
MNTCNDESALDQRHSAMVDLLFGDVLLDGLFDDIADDAGQWLASAAALGEPQLARSAAAGNR